MIGAKVPTATGSTRQLGASSPNASSGAALRPPWQMVRMAARLCCSSAIVLPLPHAVLKVPAQVAAAITIPQR